MDRQPDGPGRLLAQGPADLDQLVYGVLTARRAGVTKQDVANTFGKAPFTKWLKSTRP